MQGKADIKVSELFFLPKSTSVFFNHCYLKLTCIYIQFNQKKIKTKILSQLPKKASLKILWQI